MVKKATSRAAKPGDGKEVLYVIVGPEIKRAVERLAEAHDRSVTKEVIVALKQYIAQHKGELGG